MSINISVNRDSPLYVMKRPDNGIVYNDLWATRSAGFLIPLFSVRTEKSLGIGDIGDLYPLIDWAAEHGQRIIQLLPLNDTRPGDPSPYAAVSAFAVNPLYINTGEVEDVTHSEEAGVLLREWEADGTLDALRRSNRIDYNAVRAVKMALLAEGFRHFLRNEWKKDTERAGEFSGFMAREEWWLRDYAIFSVLKERYKGREWRKWSGEFKFREPEAIKRLEKENDERLLFHQWLQWIFRIQWDEMRLYAHDKGVCLMGDVSFYPGIDSVDVWANPELFQMDENLELSATSGAPPDRFNPDGQNWGMPLYNWEAMEADDFSWWGKRVEGVGAFFDLYRLDHFRGFESYWRVPKGCRASGGMWVEGPGDRLLQRLLKVSLYERLIIPLAEDLGDITPEVHSLRKSLGIAGYKTFIFGWGEGETSGIASGYRYPEEYAPDFLATTGTHDTPTLSRWWKDLGDDEKEALLNHLSLPEPASFSDVKDAILQRLFHSDAQFLLLPFQDIFGLGEEHRINFPGTFGEQNWTWRMPWTVEELMSGKGGQLRLECRKLREMAHRSGRSFERRGEAQLEIAGTLPPPGAVQERKSGEMFNVWAAVRGKPEGAVMSSDIAEGKETYMTMLTELRDGVKLYRGELKAEKAGNYSLRICADGAEVVLEDCLRVVDY